MVQCQFTISRPNIKIASVLAFSCVGKNLLQYRLRKKVDVKLTLTYFGDTVEKKPGSLKESRTEITLPNGGVHEEVGTSAWPVEDVVKGGR